MEGKGTARRSLPDRDVVRLLPAPGGEGRGGGQDAAGVEDAERREARGAVAAGPTPFPRRRREGGGRSGGGRGERRLRGARGSERGRGRSADAREF